MHTLSVLICSGVLVTTLPVMVSLLGFKTTTNSSSVMSSVIYKTNKFHTCMNKLTDKHTIINNVNIHDMALFVIHGNAV